MKQKQSPLDPPKQLELIYTPLEARPLAGTAIPAMRQWFRVNEAAEIFGVSKSQIHNWIDDGTLEARSVARVFDPDNPPQVNHKRITRESIIHLLNDQRRVTT